MSRHAETSHPVHELHAQRRSPLAFSDRPVAVGDLGSLFEAARWSASSFNEQPWRFFLATKDEPELYERLHDLLVPGNQGWAHDAPVLALSVASKSFARNGKPNRHAWHDVGLAVGALTLQAQALGLSVHQMAGFDHERARAVLGIPDDFEPVAMIAIGYEGDAASLPEDLRARDAAPRARRPLTESVFGAGWNAPHAPLDGAT